jgi:hypothetical protein
MVNVLEKLLPQVETNWIFSVWLKVVEPEQDFITCK